MDGDKLLIGRRTVRRFKPGPGPVDVPRRAEDAVLFNQVPK